MKKVFTILISMVLFTFVANSQCNWIYYHPASGILDDNVNTLFVQYYPDFDQEIIIAGTGYGAIKSGLSVFEDGSWTTYEESAITDAISAIAYDPDSEKIWYGGYATGLYERIDTSSVKNYTVSNSDLKSNDVEALAYHNGYLWVGSFGEGISRYDIDNDTWENFKEDSSNICDDYISSIVVGPDGGIYILGYNGCISKYDGNDFTTIPIPSIANEAYKIVIDANGNIHMIGADSDFDGFYGIYDGSSWNTTVDFGFLGASFYFTDLAANDDGEVLISTGGKGVAYFDGTNWSKYDRNGGLASDNVNAVAFDKKGNIWFGSDAGVTVLSRTVEFRGEVVFKSNLVNDGIAVLLKETKTGAKSYMGADTVALNGGTFTFPKVGYGKYLLYVKPDAVTYPDAVPTYYNGTAQWDEAMQVEVKDCDSSYSMFMIMVVEKVSIPQGNGRISGYIKSLDGTRAESNPIKDVDVTLKKVPGGVVNNARTDQNGFYKFTGLPDGVYKVLVDLPGLPQDSIREVEITSTDTVFENQDYGIDSNGIHTDDFSSVSVVTKRMDLSVYPNPATDKINIQFNAVKDDLYNIEILDTRGSIIWTEKLNCNDACHYEFNTSSLPQGLYLVRVKYDNYLWLNKVIVQ